MQPKEYMPKDESTNASTTQPATRLSPAQLEAKLKLDKASRAISEKLKQGGSLAGHNTP
jgi:hypothetical protein